MCYVRKTIYIWWENLGEVPDKLIHTKVKRRNVSNTIAWQKSLTYTRAQACSLFSGDID